MAVSTWTSTFEIVEGHSQSKLCITIYDKLKLCSHSHPSGTTIILVKRKGSVQISFNLNEFFLKKPWNGMTFIVVYDETQ